MLRVAPMKIYKEKTEDIQGENGQATEEVTKIKIHLICRTD